MFAKNPGEEYTLAERGDLLFSSHLLLSFNVCVELSSRFDEASAGTDFASLFAQRVAGDMACAPLALAIYRFG